MESERDSRSSKIIALKSILSGVKSCQKRLNSILNIAKTKILKKLNRNCPTRTKSSDKDQENNGTELQKHAGCREIS